MLSTVDDYLTRHQVYPSVNAAMAAEIPRASTQTSQVGLNQFSLGMVDAIAGPGWPSASRAASGTASDIGTKVV